MKNQYQKEFRQFLSSVKQFKDAENATYELSEAMPNAVVLSGEIIGNETQEKIINVGKKYGLLVMASELSVLYRSVWFAHGDS